MHRSLRSRQWFLGFAHMSTRSKRGTHYDTLEINHGATQNEIKSAYFKLTKQYHPDKNSSDEAKIKFQNISDAYEILGNYDKRKQYDRGLQIISPTRQTTPHRSPFTSTLNVEQEAARVQEEFNRQAQANSVNMDNWTDAYYERVMQRKRSDEERGRRLRKERSEYAKKGDAESQLMMLFVFMIVLLFVFGTSQESKWRDVPKYQIVDPKPSTSDDRTK